MARKSFKKGFREEAVAYRKAHPDKTIKACANDLKMGYSTLRRWMNEEEARERNTAGALADKAIQENLAHDKAAVSEVTEGECTAETEVVSAEEAETEVIEENTSAVPQQEAENDGEDTAAEETPAHEPVASQEETAKPPAVSEDHSSEAAADFQEQRPDGEEASEEEALAEETAAASALPDEDDIEEAATEMQLVDALSYEELSRARLYGKKAVLNIRRAVLRLRIRRKAGK